MIETLIFSHYLEVYSSEIIQQTAQHPLFHTFITVLLTNQSTASSIQVRYSWFLNTITCKT